MLNRFPVFNRIIHNKFLFLLVSLALYVGIGPFLRDFIRVRLLMDILFSVVLISGIYALSQSKTHAITAAIIAFPMFGLIWISHFTKVPAVFMTAQVLTLTFLIYITLIVLKTIFVEKKITADIIFSAIIVYLLIGLIWAILFSFLETVQPGSLSIKDGPVGKGFYLYTYFSFTTLTTLGYGDISPLTDRAASLAIFEAIIGQIYLTVVIARLVGIHISQSMANK